MPARPSTPSRRRLPVLAAGLVALALAASGCAGNSSAESEAPSADAPQDLTYQLGWLPTVEWGANWIADAEGYYEDEGVAFDWLPGGPNVSPDTVVTAGTATVGNASAEVVAAAVSEGAPLKIIGAGFKRSPFSIVSLAGTPIETPEDMLGKRIGVAAANQTQFELFLALNDIDAADLTVVPVQFDPSPVANGEVDGQVVYSINEPGQLNVQGIETHTMLFADHGFDVLTDVYFATEQTIEEQPELLAAFLRATQQGWTALFEDPQKGVDLTVGEYGGDQGLDPEQQLLEVEAMKELVLPEGSDEPVVMSEEQMQATVETIAEMGVDISVDELFDTTVQDLL
ncbi:MULTISPECIES: ABC transporter substrate-binding protein [unclassified Modestobacter]